MIGIIVQLAISWIVIWVMERKSISVLGFYPTQQRIKHFLLFFMLTAAGCVSGFLLKMFIAKQQWMLNGDCTTQLLLNGIWFTIKSVLFEELIFRGALLYILIKRIGMVKAVLISAASFGVYHWFTYEILGNPSAMLIVWMVTGAMGWVLAYAFAKSQSLYIPIAIHLGWNLITQNVFSNGPIGEQLFSEVLPRPEVTVSYFSYFMVVYFSVFATLILNGWLIHRINSTSEG